MSSLIVHNLDDALVSKLKQQAAKHARSAEAEHRAILEAALIRTCRRPLAEVLAKIPDVGRDEDFDRRQDEDRSVTDIFT